MRIKALLLTLLLAAGAVAGPAAAQGRGQGIEPGWIMPAQARGEERREDRRQDRRQEILSLREIVASVRARFGGELISARLEDGAQPFYVLRWRMANDEVRDLIVDAVSGQIR